ncbi:MarR family transcriptional regulator [Rhodobacter aestuarii]|uniref:Transcriptional regulator, MarR family n=1 Tax=Rhodobacter aestuarii TaxID=453582 RepID=A0A1N7L198_9RHOB|nr:MULTISPECIES: MarR family transcriptional regulator [Rhodobacter]PTV95445.1 MarR family transcriptional regulator [Rhodobacter aestuarii]SIS67629.1 transcriptional regulator, MarR family [Rhodobacter aestuarii]SOB90133.1 MarR family transcriptional regulator [Rhodobacter sp. JA431]
MNTDDNSAMTSLPENAVEDDLKVTIGGLQIDVLEGAFSWYIRSLDSVVSRDLDARMAHLEIARGKGKITAILLVDDYPGIRPSQIAEVLMRDRPATGRIIEGMVAAGLIRREEDPADQRAQSLFITEKGQALAQEVRAIIRAQEEEFFDFIAPEDRAQFMRMLKRAYLNMRTKCS